MPSLQWTLSKYPSYIPESTWSHTARLSRLDSASLSSNEARPRTSNEGVLPFLKHDHVSIDSNDEARVARRAAIALEASRLRSCLSEVHI